ncbi:uncharacterized protein LOC130654123 [Hydractinia symbiolongicarpus]|uniref:uncharacterized protein LOC130654123 n=1 Tax=Hydractinia symbiolongicarpus TaxID=13093 RepID=UPI00254A350C|nr:uncharacterized protein LOC130654123 [Hydractinia symbiolongicarpus]
MDSDSETEHVTRRKLNNFIEVTKTTGEIVLYKYLKESEEQESLENVSLTAATIENVQSSMSPAINEPIVETSAGIDVDFSSSDGGMRNVSLAATNALNSL